MIWRATAAITAVEVLVAGCSSNDARHASDSSGAASAAASSSAYSPALGADAAGIAGHIRGCADVTAQSVGAGSSQV